MNYELRCLTGVDRFTPKRFLAKAGDPKPVFMLRAPTFAEMAELANLSQIAGNPDTHSLAMSMYGSMVAYACRCLVGWENVTYKGKLVPFVGVRGPAPDGAPAGPCQEDLDKLDWLGACEIAERVRVLGVVTQPDLT